MEVQKALSLEENKTCVQNGPNSKTAMDLIDSQLEISSVIFIFLYLLVFMSGMFLNILAMWVFFQIRTQKRTFMLYLCNMVVADLLMTLTLPVNILIEAKVAPLWLHVVSCNYTAVLFYCCMYANILFLGLVAVDRYLKIVRPFGGTRSACFYSYSFTRAMAVMVWFAMMAFSLPNTILSNNTIPESMNNCANLKDDLGKTWHKVVSYVNILIFFLVLITLLTCYMSIYRHIYRSSKKFTVVGEASPRKAKKGQNILVLLVVFFICFVPYHLCRIPFTNSQTAGGGQVDFTLMTGKKATLLISIFNVCLDPIIYFFMCKSFRRKMSETLGCGDKMSTSSPTSTRKSAVVMIFKESSSSP